MTHGSRKTILHPTFYYLTLDAMVNIPQEQIEMQLGAFWDERAITVDGSSQSILDPGAPLSSVDASEAVIEMEKILSIKLPIASVIKNSGYENRELFIKELTAGIMKHIGT